jgi:energy-coupling factor transport system ATP-binding protein
VAEQRVGKWFDYTDKIIMLEEGRLIYIGSRQEMYSTNNKYIASFLPSYLKLCKGFNIESMPGSIKESRECFINYKINLNIGNNEETEKKEIININNLNCIYEEVRAIKNLSCSIFEGDFLGILGSNGAGKSTLLKSMIGLVKYSGSIRLTDGEIKKLKLKELSRIIGYVSQNPNDYISKDTVFDELKFTLDNYGIYDEELICQTLRDLDIYHLKDSNPRDISGGERQRVAIASVLVLKPRIILLDEPTRGLHGEAKKKLGEMLGKLNKYGATVILVTHDIEFASQFCNRFLLMFGGEKVAEGDAKEVLGKGIYYTTTINKLLRNINEDIFTLDQALNGDTKYEKN